ncbi:uncharacterized protein TM35_000016380 [Trypanosoma theileri]|uniref:Uncharacterized protein n=1 Tax=Trypanosoma theileri TaxID=67003 RepID=A0A1X0PAB1_9TRYP|nr:uncharacterized protein TM35_000016380 [Trypanosoma theileri]ORC93761.1 hypothetical protein TM35_000016380 [Trypanosoma theileri]
MKIKKSPKAPRETRSPPINSFPSFIGGVGEKGRGRERAGLRAKDTPNRNKNTIKVFVQIKKTSLARVGEREKTWAATGIEPVTSCTRNRNHTTRPSGRRTKCLLNKELL